MFVGLLPHPNLPYTHIVAPECSLPYRKELHTEETVLYDSPYHIC